MNIQSNVVAIEKCGEIMLSHKTKFIFVCAFCNEEFKEMLSFGKHVHQDHLKVDKKEFKDTTETTTKSSLNSIQLGNEAKNEDAVSTLSQDKAVFNSDNIEIGSECVETLNELNYVPVEAIYLPTISEHQNNTDSDDLVLITPQGADQHDEKLPNDSAKCSAISTVYLNEKNQTTDTQILNNQDDDSIKNIPNKLGTFECFDCNEVFRRKDQLVHHSRIHTGGKNKICPHCSKRFRSKTELARHIRTHTGERPFECTHCPKTFSDKTGLDIHIRRHLGEKRYACDLCDKRFVHSTDIKVHMRSHTGEKSYQCDECGSNYTTSGSLGAHKKRHLNIKKYKCEACSKGFVHSWELRKHLIVHSKERPFQCKICLVTYPRKDSLRAHMKIHSDVKEYVCEICSKAFAQQPGLYSHMKSHGVKLGQKIKGK